MSPHASANRVVPWLMAGCLGVLQPACTVANPAASTPRTQAAPMSTSFPSNELLIQEGARRLIAMVPAGGTLAVWMELGPGPVAAQAKADLLARLQGDKRIVWSQTSSQPGGPVADPSRPGQHVNTVTSRIDPKPQLVLLVSFSQGRLYLGARPPGLDPLGPQTTEWTWLLNGP